MMNDVSTKFSPKPFLILAFWMCIAVYSQSYLVYSFPSIFKHIDFVTVFLMLIFFKNPVLISMMLALFIGSLLDSLSTIKPGFFIFYYLIALICVKAPEKFFYGESFINKTSIFTIVMFIKYIFLYALIISSEISIFTFIHQYYLQFLLSTFTFIILAILIKTTGSVFDQPHVTKKIY